MFSFDVLKKRQKENSKSHVTKNKQGQREGRAEGEGTNQSKKNAPQARAKAASTRARMIGKKRHRQALRIMRAKRCARKSRDERRREKRQQEKKRRQRQMRKNEPMRVGINIFTAHLFLGMLRFGVEHAPHLPCDYTHFFLLGFRRTAATLE